MRFLTDSLRKFSGSKIASATDACGVPFVAIFPSRQGSTTCRASPSLSCPTLQPRHASAHQAGCAAKDKRTMLGAHIRRKADSTERASLVECPGTGDLHEWIRT